MCRGIRLASAAVAALGMACAAAQAAAMVSGLAAQSQLPLSIMDPELPDRFVWRSAEVMVGPDGMLVEDAPRHLRQSVARGRGTGDGCIEEIAYFDAFDGANTSPPKDLREFVSLSVAPLIGTVTALHPGYSRGAGQMLEVYVGEASWSASNVDGASTVYAFYPAGDVWFGGSRVCRVNPRIPLPPRVGDRVVLAPRRPAVLLDPVVFLLHRTGYEVAIYPPDGPARLPETLTDLLELKAPRSMRWLERQIASIAQR